MSVALYRKYRPQTFAEVIGQDHIVKVLAGAIAADAISHAYLFAGSRGTGKTSVARIFARQVGTTSNDLYEIDAASSRGIDEIRELREAVNTLPFDSKFKVYIIDEAHMLTKEAFNALLKTLEEPPSHVIFILATTERYRVPETIISRCQNFAFKKPSTEELKSLLLAVAKKEKFKLETDAADLVALVADGSFRDAVGILQQARSASGEKAVTLDLVETVTGAPRAALVSGFILTLLEAESAKALEIVATAAAQGHDIKMFIKLVLAQVRLALIKKFSPKLADTLTNGLSVNENIFLDQVANHAKVARLPDILRALLATYDEVGKSAVPHLPLELAVIQLLKTDK
ncbi:MAG: DNA polymerase III subunit gamma/tau [Candidatus Vogelbacteria bacterium]|nr:DNA polymerase III subunit gamma/tau [Candidatus Vogelbacteria bacterium]